MTLSADTIARYQEIESRFNGITRTDLYAALNKVEGGFDAGLAVLDAMLHHRVYTYKTLARTANLQGFKMDEGAVWIQIGRIAKALAEAMGLDDLVIEYGALCNNAGICWHDLLANPSYSKPAILVGQESLQGGIARDGEGNLIWALRPGLCL